MKIKPQLTCMELDDNKRQQSGEDGRAGSRTEYAAAQMRPWRHISGQLATLIGESGFCALFGRALRTLAVRYDWLTVDATPKSIDGLLQALERDLASTEPSVSGIANTELLNTFTRQLSTLIGEALTARLLVQVTALEQEGPNDVQEHK